MEIILKEKEEYNVDKYDLKLAEENPEIFWEKIASELYWFKKWEKVLEINYPFHKWFIGGKTNIVYNCLDRYINTWRKNKVAIYWEGENYEKRTISYFDLFKEVNKLSNALKDLGIKKGDRVVIYLPRIPEQIISMLAVARIGAIHSVVYAGFSSQALRDRIIDAEAKIVITADGYYYRGKIRNLKEIVDEAIKDLNVEKVIVVERLGIDVEMKGDRDIYYKELVKNKDEKCPAEIMDSEDPLFILYTSGTTGKPKGVLHVHGGYMVGVYATTKLILDVKDDDIYWCTADPGWITGHSYIVYGPLLNNATILFYEGAPDYPNIDRWWELIERYKVTIFYTTPTALRYFKKFGEEPINKHDISSLRLLGTVGEPINPEVWLWFYKVIGKERCPIVDTWWQTETGMHVITTYPNMKMKPGYAGKGILGIKVDVADENGNILKPGEKGHLVIKNFFPALMRTIYKNEERYKSYFKHGLYYAGDYAIKDEEGYIMILGRSDEVIKTSGYRLGTFEIESAIVSHEAVAEAAVIGKPHEVKGEIIKAFVVLKEGYEPSEELKDSIRKRVREILGPIAVPAEIEFVKSLPKTRSGKIMRRVLKAKELGLPLGDLSTLEEE